MKKLKRILFPCRHQFDMKDVVKSGFDSDYNPKCISCGEGLIELESKINQPKELELLDNQ